MKAIIFDLDGVLFDSEPLHRAAWINSLKSLGHTIDEESLMEWTGIPCKALAERYSDTLVPRRPWTAYYQAKAAELKSLISRELIAFQDVPDLIATLSSRFLLGFATSNYRDDAELMLEQASLRDLFSAGVCFDDTVNHKPDPEPYLTAARKLECHPADCYALEDSPSGLTSAKSAGMRVFAITSTYQADELPGAHAVFSSTADACRAILKDKTPPQ